MSSKMLTDAVKVMDSQSNTCTYSCSRCWAYCLKTFHLDPSHKFCHLYLPQEKIQVLIKVNQTIHEAS